MSDPMVCHRCPGVVMDDDGEWFTCPCCHCRTRGIERQQARHEQSLAELGMTEDEYTAHCRSFIDTRPLSDAALARLRTIVMQRAEEWVPVCEHDTNPWTQEAGQ